MKRLVVVAIICLFAIFPSITFGQSAKDALRSLQKLQARVEAGISLRDYSPALGDALFKVKLFLESPEAKKKPELVEAINRAMEHYRMAGTVWDASGGYPCTTDVYPIANIYPELKNEWTSCNSTDPPAYRLSVAKILEIIWKEANKELKKAVALFSQN